jgi:hypothetical protein
MPQVEKNLARSPFGHIASRGCAYIHSFSGGSISIATSYPSAAHFVAGDAPINAEKRLAVGE